MLYLSPKHPQYRSIAPCWYNGSKLSIVLPIKRDQKGGDTYGQYTKVWCAFSLTEVLDGVEVDGLSVDGVLENTADFLEELIKVVSHRLSERCMQGLPSYIEHIVMPVAAACRPHYERLWRVQRPKVVLARVTLCDKICSLLDGHPRQAHHWHGVLLKIKLVAWLSCLCCLVQKRLAVLACCLNPNPLSIQLYVQLKDVQELMSSMRFLDPAKTSHLSWFLLVCWANVGFHAWYKR